MNEEDQSASINTSKKDFLITDEEEKSLLLPEAVQTGLSWQLATLFIMGEILGGGVVSIGGAMTNTGWCGLGVMIMALMACMYMGTIHSEVMCNVSQSYGRLNQLRNPYSGVIEQTLGRSAKILSRGLLSALTICFNVVYLLISAEFIVIVVNDLFPSLRSAYEFRIWLLIFAICLIPMTWLGTPKEFWGVALGAATSIVIGSILLVYIVWTDNSKSLSEVPQRDITVASFFTGFGTIFFAYNANPFYPNIQSDMKDQRKFSKAIKVSSVLVSLVYVPVALTGFLAYGDNIKDNIVDNIFEEHSRGHGYISQRVICYIILVMFAGHFTFAYSLIFNVTAQEAEDYFQVPRGFCWQRCLLRTCLVLLTLVLAQAIPKFNIILSLVGGTIQTMLAFQIPALAYYKQNPNLRWWTKLFMSLCFLIALIGMIGTIYASVMNVIALYR